MTPIKSRRRRQFQLESLEGRVALSHMGAVVEDGAHHHKGGHAEVQTLRHGADDPANHDANDDKGVDATATPDNDANDDKSTVTPPATTTTPAAGHDANDDNSTATAATTTTSSNSKSTETVHHHKGGKAALAKPHHHVEKHAPNHK